MKVYTTAPLEDPADARTLYPHLEEIGYDGRHSASKPSTTPFFHSLSLVNTPETYALGLPSPLRSHATQ